MMMLLQVVAETHALSGTAAEWVWLLPVLPLIGFIVNGALSLAPAYRPGPGNPDMGHGEDHDATEISHAENAGAHGDDHHAVRTHRYAGLTSIIGPAVLGLS